MHCWNIYLKKCFAAFFTESKSYSFNKTATLVYGLLNLGNYETISFHPQLKSNINDTVWVEEVYHSLIPVIKESWNILDQDTKRIYTEIIKYTETYIHTFNFKEELKYQKEAPLEKFISCSCKSSGKNEFRKAEAFIFRRICDSHAGKGNWTIPWTKKMLLILQTELDIK